VARQAETGLGVPGMALLRCGVSTVPILNRRQPVAREVTGAVTTSHTVDLVGAPSRIGHGEVPVQDAGIDYRERLAQQLSDTVFDELNALATRLAAEASRAQGTTQRAWLMAEADTVARLLTRLRTTLFTLDAPDPNLPAT
jgi:hypothetical protein